MYFNYVAPSPLMLLYQWNQLSVERNANKIEREQASSPCVVHNGTGLQLHRSRRGAASGPHARVTLCDSCGGGYSSHGLRAVARWCLTRSS
jgi:hypothetical protein